MIIMLQPDQITAFWDAIKHGLIIANRVDKLNEQAFCNRMLENLLVGKAQAWVGCTEREGERIFHAYGITAIKEDDLSGEKMLYLHTLYAFRPITDELLQEMMPTLNIYAKEAECTKMYVLTSNKRLQEYYQQHGFAQNPMLFVKEV